MKSIEDGVKEGYSRYTSFALTNYREKKLALKRHRNAARKGLWVTTLELLYESSWYMSITDSVIKVSVRLISGSVFLRDECIDFSVCLCPIIFIFID